MSYNEKLYGNKLRPRFRDWTEFNAFQDAQGIDKSLREIPFPSRTT